MDRNFEKDKQKAVDLTNDFLNNFIKTINPKKFEGHFDVFIKICMGCANLISATMIEKMAGTFGLNVDGLKQLHIDTLDDYLKFAKEHCNDPKDKE